MKHTTLKLVTAAVIVATTALISGCSNKAQDIDLTLIGGDGQDIENRYTVDIRYDTDEAPINSDTAIVISTAEPEEISEPDIPKEKTTAPETTPATTKATQPAVTITTDKPPVTTPAQTVRTDLPKVTAEPQYTTAATTTTKPAKQTEPAEIKTDENGFPAILRMVISSRTVLVRHTSMMVHSSLDGFPITMMAKPLFRSSLDMVIILMERENRCFTN